MYNKIYNRLKNADLILTILVVVCCGLGVLIMLSMIYNSGYADITAGVSGSMLITKAVAVLIGLLAALFITIAGQRRICRLYIPIAIAGIALCLLTFTSLGIGPENSDDKAWLSIFGKTIQPTELLKICFIITFSAHLQKLHDKINRPLVLLGMLVHIGVPTLICFLQGDQGTSVIFIIIGVIMLIAGGLSWKYIAGVLAASPVIIFILWNFVLQTHQKNRILILFNPENDPYGYGYQQLHGIAALKSGGIFGKGLFAGENADWLYVSEAQNDFVFSYIGQTMGIVGCIAVVLLIVLILVRLICDAKKAETFGGKMICIGVFGLLLSHSIINIGMVLGFMPVIGVPLPFFSAGGTAMISILIATGLVQSVVNDKFSNRKATKEIQTNN